MGNLSGFICSSSVYCYEGWLFEAHRWYGPWPLTKEGELRKRAGKKFWDMWGRWDALPPEEKIKTRTDKGGCQQF